MADGNDAKSAVDVKEEKRPGVNPEAKDHWKKGNGFFEESKFEEAIKEFTEAIRIDKDYADAYFNRALTERVINDFMSARADLEKVIELQPKSADAPLLIGDMAETNKDMLGARYWYEKALSNNPEYIEAKNRLERIDALVHVDSGVPTSAKGSAGKMAAPSTKPLEQKEVIEEGQLRGSMVLGMEDPASRMTRLGKSELVYPRLEPVDEILAKIAAVTHDDIRAVAATVLARPKALAVVGPYDDADGFEAALAR